MGDLGSRVLVSFRFDRVCFDDVRTTCRFLDLGQYCVLCLSSSATVPLPMAIDIVLVGIVLVRLKIEVLGSDVPKMLFFGWTCLLEHFATKIRRKYPVLRPHLPRTI